MTIPADHDPDTLVWPPGLTPVELCRSETALRCAIDNEPPPALLADLHRLATGLAAIEALLGASIEISSGYRCDALNAAVGGVPGSQHTRGQAADFGCPARGTPEDIAVLIAGSSIEFDQLILEFGRWVHVSFSPAPRRRPMTIWSSAEGYLDGIVARDGVRLA